MKRIVRLLNAYRITCVILFATFIVGASSSPDDFCGRMFQVVEHESGCFIEQPSADERLDWTNLPRRIVLPDTFNGKKIVGISHRAFYGCTNVEEVVVGKYVEEISFESFCECVGLRRIILPDTVRRIKIGAFRRCVNLEQNSILPFQMRKNLTGHTMLY